MRRREEKRREFHEALLQTLYPPSSPSSSPSSLEVVDDKPFDVTLINPEDYVKIGSSNHGDVNENGEESETAEKPSRAQRKRLRKKMLKEEAARRKKVIGPLLPTEMLQIPDGRRVGDAGESNVKEDSDCEEEAGGSNICSQLVRPNAQEEKEDQGFDFNLLPTEMLQIPDGRSVGDAGESNVKEDSDGEEEAGGSNICSQLVRPNAEEKKEEKIGGNNMRRRVKKRREAKKLATESCKIQDPTPENQIPN